MALTTGEKLFLSWLTCVLLGCVCGSLCASLNSCPSRSTLRVLSPPSLAFIVGLAGPFPAWALLLAHTAAAARTFTEVCVCAPACM